MNAGTVAIPDQIVAVLQSIKADLIQAKGEHTKVSTQLPTAVNVLFLLFEVIPCLHWHLPAGILHVSREPILSYTSRRMQLRSENEQLSTEVAKQKYRVDKHILPYVEQLRNENSKLKAALAEQQSSGGVEGVSKGVSGLSLS